MYRGAHTHSSLLILHLYTCVATAVNLFIVHFHTSTHVHKINKYMAVMIDGAAKSRLTIIVSYTRNIRAYTRTALVHMHSHQRTQSEYLQQKSIIIITISKAGRFLYISRQCLCACTCTIMARPDVESEH